MMLSVCGMHLLLAESIYKVLYKKLSNQGDGIIYSIQHESDGFMVRDSLLQAGSKTNNLNCDVKVGDRLFFRLQSRYDGEYDKVLWNPIITYTSLPVGKDRYLSKT